MRGTPCCNLNSAVLSPRKPGQQSLKLVTVQQPRSRQGGKGVQAWQAPCRRHSLTWDPTPRILNGLLCHGSAAPSLAVVLSAWPTCTGTQALGLGWGAAPGLDAPNLVCT